jgi:hypothetical protein
LSDEAKRLIAAQVEQLLYAQTFVAYPGVQLPVALYWQDGTLMQWRQQTVNRGERSTEY